MRRFARCYTRRIGALNEGLLNTTFTLTEARVLFEIGYRAVTRADETSADETSAAAIGADLGLDAGYLSRILAGFEADGLVARRPSPADARRQVIVLTDAGRETFADLDAKSREAFGAMLAPFDDVDRQRLLDAMRSIEELLTTDRRRDPPRLRPHQPGDLGWIVERHAVLYTQDHGWDASFEAVVAEIAADLIRLYDPRRDLCLIAERDGRRLGSAALVADREGGDGDAKLRIVIVDPAARGLGLGRRLVRDCLAFGKSAGYARVSLWTFDILTAAGRIYASEGFRCVEETPTRQFGVDMIEQRWALDLEAWS